MDSDRRRLPGIVRREALAPTNRPSGLYRASTMHVDAPRRPGPRAVETGALTMEAPRRDKPGLWVQVRDAWASLVPYVDAVWQHLRVNWTDGLLALGFLAVILLSAYILVRG